MKLIERLWGQRQETHPTLDPTTFRLELMILHFRLLHAVAERVVTEGEQLSHRLINGEPFSQNDLEGLTQLHTETQALAERAKLLNQWDEYMPTDTANFNKL